MEDAREAAKKWLGKPSVKKWGVVAKLFGSLIAALLIAWIPAYSGLEPAGRCSLFILVLATGLWITEAIAPFAVGLIVIALEIMILGRPGGVMNAAPNDWEKYVATWGSPLIWLFFGGFVLAAAAEKTGLTIWLSRHILSRISERPWWLLAGCMGITFVFSMFISNTAATVMMVAIVMPIVNALAGGDRLRKALLLGVALSANIGGMGTVIGSPPNAIAVGALRHTSNPIGFAEWMTAALPPALILLVIVWGYLLARYPAWVERVDFVRMSKTSPDDSIPYWRRATVMSVFAVTICLWMTESLHGVPATVVSFIPICVFSATGILNSADVRSLRWDMLLLIAGGLSLGLAVTETGLAEWIVTQLPLQSIGFMGVLIVIAYATMLFSNLMSNTAAANVFVPIAIAAAVGFEAQAVVPVALSASAAMALPISTPPNAIVFGTEEVTTNELIECGLIVGLLGPIIAVLWCRAIFG